MKFEECPLCGVFFDPDCYHCKKKYCSKECKEEALRISDRIYYLRKKIRAV